MISKDFIKVMLSELLILLTFNIISLIKKKVIIKAEKTIKRERNRIF